MADYAFDCLGNCDILEEYRRCCDYHIGNFRKSYENGKEAFVIQLLNEANILACLKRSKYWLNEAWRNGGEERQSRNVRCSQEFVSYDSAELENLPTDLAVDHLPRDESRLTLSISRCCTGKLPSASQSSARSKSNIKLEEPFGECGEQKTHKNTLKFPPRRKQSNSELRDTVDTLLLYYATSLALDKRYRDAKSIVLELAGDIQKPSTVARAHLAKLVGTLLLVLEPEEMLEAEKYVTCAEAFFVCRKLYPGQAACNLALVSINKSELSKHQQTVFNCNEGPLDYLGKSNSSKQTKVDMHKT
eukprot:TRINITY_DN10068_c0_g1_i12.p1 TRINITY_DN10068_c0_g1~~TRINITY_DN10068_c0_g1_i12.p1  ORF type:complete len:303 (+),score=88.05 TRINITY_DN10068_c0_g1_i12:304-1212(+)